MSVVKKIKLPTFEKSAAVRSALGDNPNNYPSELLAILFHQYQFLGDYDVTVQIHSQDDMAGYMYGVFVVRPQSAVPDASANSVRIPLVVAGRRAFPFDVFITKEGKFSPLTQSRVTSALFNPTIFNAVSKSSLPSQAQVGPGGFPVANENLYSNERYGQMKSASASILDAILPTVTQEDVDAFLAAAAATEGVTAAIQAYPSFKSVLLKVANSTRSMAEETSPVFPVASVLEKKASGFVISYALADADGALKRFSALSMERADVEKLPLHVKQAALQQGYVALGCDENAGIPVLTSDSAELAEAAEITAPGVYAVMTKQAQPASVLAFNKLTMLDGKQLNAVLLVDENGAGTLMEKAAGVYCGELRGLEKVAGAELRGEGVFLLGDTFTEPLRIRATFAKEDGYEFQVSTSMGQSHLLKVAAVKKLAAAGGNTILLPATARFVPLKQGTTYITDPDKIKVAASISEYADTFTFKQNTHGGADAFDCDGLQIGASTGDAGTVLMLLALGDSPEGALAKTAAIACGKKPVRVVSKRRVKKEAVLEKKASLDVSAVRTSLIKEAALLAAPDTIEAVLSLSFVTPENATKYVEFIPTFEDALSKLAETLLGARIGVPDVPEGALASAMGGLERAIQGLKKLQIRLSLPEEA